MQPSRAYSTPVPGRAHAHAGAREHALEQVSQLPEEAARRRRCGTQLHPHAPSCQAHPSQLVQSRFTLPGKRMRTYVRSSHRPRTRKMWMCHPSCGLCMRAGRNTIRQARNSAARCRPCNSHASHAVHMNNGGVTQLWRHPGPPSAPWVWPPRNVLQALLAQECLHRGLQPLHAARTVVPLAVHHDQVLQALRRARTPLKHP